MAHKRIEIPGNTTRYDGGPIVKIEGAEDEDVRLTIRYHASSIDAPGGPKYGEITFKSLLEYRWIADSFYYQSVGDTEDFAFTLIEILDSPKIEEMASRGSLRDYPGERFGGVIKESDVRHFRIGFDEYGTFDIIALGIAIREIPNLTTD